MYRPVERGIETEKRQHHIRAQPADPLIRRLEMPHRITVHLMLRLHIRLRAREGILLCLVPPRMRPKRRRVPLIAHVANRQVVLRKPQLQFRFEMPEMIHATGHARADDHNGIALV